ncbi:hypothetical protein [Nitrosomonas sp. wSCUT-2]
MDIQNKLDRLLPARIFALMTGIFCALWFYQANVLETVQNDHKVGAQERQILENRLNQLRSDLQTHEHAASQARFEWNHEVAPGKRFRAAKMREEEAVRHAERVRQEIKQHNAQLTALCY